MSSAIKRPHSRLVETSLEGKNSTPHSQKITSTESPLTPKNVTESPFHLTSKIGGNGKELFSDSRPPAHFMRRESASSHVAKIEGGDLHQALWFQVGPEESVVERSSPTTSRVLSISPELTQDKTAIASIKFEPIEESEIFITYGIIKKFTPKIRKNFVTQQKAMHNISATYAAFLAGVHVENVVFHWMHIIAFSLAGLDRVNPNIQKNLIVGTAAANYRHYIFERIVKLLAVLLPKAQLRISFALLDPIQASLHVFKYLHYEIAIYDHLNKNFLPLLKVNINLLETTYPTFKDDILVEKSVRKALTRMSDEAKAKYGREQAYTSTMRDFVEKRSLKKEIELEITHQTGFNINRKLNFEDVAE